MSISSGFSFRLRYDDISSLPESNGKGDAEMIGFGGFDFLRWRDIEVERLDPDQEGLRYIIGLKSGLRYKICNLESYIGSEGSHHFWEKENLASLICFWLRKRTDNRDEYLDMCVTINQDDLKMTFKTALSIYEVDWRDRDSGHKIRDQILHKSESNIDHKDYKRSMVDSKKGHLPFT